MKKEELRALLEEAGVRPSRGEGQNFLVEENLAAAIARDGLADADPARTVVLEVGPGVGILTEHLVAGAARVLAVDIEDRLVALTRARLGDPPGLRLLHADVLADKSHVAPAVVEAARALLRPGDALRVVSNLPYSIATPLVLGLLGLDLPLERLVVMVQLEVAERFAAPPGGEAFGAVSVLCQAACASVELVRRVPPEVFWPRPKVTSAVVRLDPGPGRREALARLAAPVRALFDYRRKTLARAAREVAARTPDLAWLPQAVALAGLDPTRRAETLSLGELEAIVARRPAAGTDPGGASGKD